MLVLKYQRTVFNLSGFYMEFWSLEILLEKKSTRKFVGQVSGPGPLLSFRRTTSGQNIRTFWLCSPRLSFFIGSETCFSR